MKLLKSIFFATVISMCATASAAKSIDWTFNKESGMKGWRVTPGTAVAIELLPGGLKMLSARDCQIATVVKFQADDLSVLKITMKTDKDGVGQFFFTKPGMGFNVKACINFKVKSGEHIYTIDCASNKLWNGTINALRFDPTNDVAVEILIKSIKLLPPRS